MISDVHTAALLLTAVWGKPNWELDRRLSAEDGLGDGIYICKAGEASCRGKLRSVVAGSEAGPFLRCS